jgi:regulatory protein
MARRAAKFAPPELPPSSAASVITVLNRAPDDPSILTIRVGRKSAGRINELAAADLGIGIGAPWTDRMREAVASAMLLANARDWAIHAVARRAMSKSMLSQKLAQRGLPRPDATRIAAELQTAGLIDEKRFAEGVVETTLARKATGTRLLVNTLRAKGIEGKMAAKAVDKVTQESDYNPREAALALARRKLRVMGTRLEPQAKQRRLYGLLARRGFDAELCREVVATVIRTPDE